MEHDIYIGKILTPESIIVNYSLSIPDDDLRVINNDCNGNIKCMAKRIVSHESFKFHVKPNGDDFEIVSCET